MGNVMTPELGSLAWQPTQSWREPVIFDHYNGVPTLALTFPAGSGMSLLSWRVLGYTGTTSVWLYVPLSPDDEAKLASQVGPDMLDGIVFNLSLPLHVTVGVAQRHRLVFEQDWQMPRNTAPGDLESLVSEFTIAAMADSEPHLGIRAADVSQARQAVKQLVSLEP